MQFSHLNKKYDHNTQKNAYIGMAYTFSVGSYYLNHIITRSLLSKQWGIWTKGIIYTI